LLPLGRRCNAQPTKQQDNSIAGCVRPRSVNTDENDVDAN
jgi:hypothetical protein